MFKPSPKAILVATFTFVAASAIPGIALAKNGNSSRNGSGSNGGTNTTTAGGPPACREIQGELDQLQSMVTTLNQTIATINANVNNLNTTVTNLSGRIDTINTSIASVNATLNTFTNRFNSIETTLDVIVDDIADIQATIDADGVSGLNTSVAVDTTVCLSGATQCASATPANSTNQNPVAVNVLVMEGSTEVTNLTTSNFSLTTDFAPGGANIDLVLCTPGKTGCGSGAFLVNSGTGGYQLYVSPTVNWMPGTYVAQLKITDTEGNSTTELVQITIPS